MRDYSKVAPQFWTGPTGKALRAAGPEALVVACYFMTCPLANMIGLYYLPLPVLCHETGIPLEGASKALRRVSATGFAHYDDETETIWVPEMARFQIEDTLKPGDKRVKGVVKELLAVRKCKFSRDFYEKYRVPFNLPELSWWDKDVEPTRRPFEGPSKALRSQEQEQEQEHKKNVSSGADAPGADTAEAPVAEQQQKPKRRTREAKPADAEWLAELKVTYAGRVDVDRELIKLDAWLLTPKGRHRKKTRSFIVGWMNRQVDEQREFSTQAAGQGANNVVPLKPVLAGGGFVR